MKANTTANLCIYLSGGLSALLGFVVMLAWLTGHHASIQISSDFVPMAFNTALCLFFSGISILTAEGKFGALSLACIGFVALFAFVVGMQYFTGNNIGIDNFFIDQYLQIRTSHPGRMAPNTVLYFLLTAGSLMSWHMIKKQDTRLSVLSIMGLIIFLLSIVALVGYFIKLEGAYSWWGMSDMAPLTAFGFLLLSIGILGIAHSHAAFSSAREMRFFKPVFVAALGITLTLLISQGLLMRDRLHVEKLAAQQSSKAAHIIKLELENDILALQRMQSRLISSSINQDVWKEDARNYVIDNPAYQSLALIDVNRNIQSEVHSHRDTQLWGELLKNSSIPALVWNEKAKMSAFPVSPYTGKKLILFILPLNRFGALQGYLAALYDVQEEIANLPPAGHGLESFLEISDKTGTIFSNKTGDDFIWQFRHVEEISFYGLTWTIAETMNISHPANRGLVILILLAGAGLSLFLAKSIWQSHEIQAHSQSLRESEERSARAINAAQVGLWDWDLQTETLIWGGSAWEIYGALDNTEIPTKADVVLGLIHENDREATQAQVQKGVESDHMFNVEYRTRRLDGREVWVQSRGKVADFKDGVPTRVSGTLMDITRRKMDEQELTRSNEELERFAYVASHDLKAPLRSIDNLAKWVLEDAGDEMPTDAKDKLTLLRGRVTRLESLLEDILSYSRAGRIVDEPVEVDMNELVSTIIQSHVREGFEADIIGTLPTIIAPRTPLEQIFGNLLTNACKHHDKKAGTITIKAEDRGLFWEFIVADDGPGIPPQFHERVFEMFQTLQPRDKVDGSGIGMSIIKKLVEWRGGKIWIRSDSGMQGTEIHFLWPKS